MKTAFTEVRASVLSQTVPESMSESTLTYLLDDFIDDFKWDPKRGLAQRLDQMLKQGNELDILAYAEKIQHCSKSLLFALEANDLGEIKHRLKSVFFCRFRHCPVCQARRARRNYVKFLKVLPNILENNSGARWVFLTLTVPNVPVNKLRETLKNMQKSWHNFLRCKEFKDVLGWVKSVEITKEDEIKTGRANYAHPHFHVLLMVKSTYFVRDNYVTRDQWLRSWCKAYQDDSIVAVDVRIADRYKGAKLAGQALVKSVSELLKYSVKPSHMLQSREWVVELIRQVYSLRFLSAGGLLKGVFVENPTNEEMIHVNEEGTLGEKTQDIRYWWYPLLLRYAREANRNF